MRSARPDLALLDINMGGMSGFELFGEMRRVSNVPVVFVTASHREEDRKRAVEIGARDYITKPFSTAEVISRLKSAFGSAA